MVIYYSHDIKLSPGEKTASTTAKTTVKCERAIANEKQH